MPVQMSAPGLIHGYSTKLAAYFNIDVKNFTRKGIDLMYKKYEPAIKFKMEHGWVKDHVKADIEAFEFVESLMRHPLNQAPQFHGWVDEKDPNNIMLRKLVLMHACIRDDDTFYDMLELVMDKWKHEHWERYEKSASMAYGLISFPVMYNGLINHLAAMQEDLPDITDEQDEPRINYIELEKRAKDELERKSK